MLRFFCLFACTLIICAIEHIAWSQEAPSSNDTGNRILGINTPPTNLTLADSAPQEAILDSGKYAYRSFIKQTHIRDRSEVYPEADIISIRYELHGPAARTMRTGIFMFNRGPGSSSI